MAKKKILLIDDNPDIVKIYTVRLEACGYEVASSLSGEDGIKLASEFQPDLIVLDISMPGMDGFDTGKRLRSSIVTQNVPIIMATAHSNRDAVIKAVSQLNVQAYLIKPFNHQQMLKEIQRILGE